MSITTREIAEICGVSRGTVDRALNDRPGINPETKKMIIEAAEKLGYRPHFIARSLVMGKTMTIGVVVFDLNNRFFAQMVNAIETKAREKGYFVYLTLTDKNPDIEKQCIEHLIDRQVDGLLLCSVNNERGYDKYLKSLNIPVVTITNRISDSFAYISIDDRLAMKQAVMYVIEKGYTRIVYISPALSYRGKMNLYALEQRLAGFKEVCKRYAAKVETIIIDNKDYNSVLDCINFKDARKTAVICTSDIFALEVMNYLKRRGIKIPDDAGVMGFDNIDVLKYVEPSLATVSYPMREIGTQAIEFLVNLIEGNNTNELPVFKHEIIEGMSLNRD